MIIVKGSVTMLRDFVCTVVNWLDDETELLTGQIVSPVSPMGIVPQLRARIAQMQEFRSKILLLEKSYMESEDWNDDD